MNRVLPFLLGIFLAAACGPGPAPGSRDDGVPGLDATADEAGPTDDGNPRDAPPDPSPDVPRDGLTPLDPAAPDGTPDDPAVPDALPGDPAPGDPARDDPSPADPASEASPDADADDPADAEAVDGPDGDAAADVPDVPDVPPPPACLGDPSLCDDGNECTRDSCDPALGCANVALDGTACDDRDACTVGDLCGEGECVPGSARSCADGDPCTDDLCDAATGCGHPFNTAACDDGNPCTQADRCGQGQCAGEPVAGACTCSETPDCAVFADGNPCHGRLVCVDERCVVEPGSVPVCDPSADPPCQRSACDPSTGGCTRFPAPDNTGCDDGNLCTTGDRCLGGACAGGAAPDCDDGNVCTTDGCEPLAGCVHGNHQGTCAAARCQGGLLYPAARCTAGACPAQVPETCNDGNACTRGDACADGACRPGPLAVDCDDGNPCTDDRCEPATGCVREDNVARCAPSACVDGVHLAAAFCAAGACPDRVATDCDSGIACRVDLCDPADGCSGVLAPGSCLIDGACHLEGEAGPEGPCHVCAPDLDPSAWTALADGAACGAGRACMEGRCLGPLVTEFMALNQGTLRDEDGASSDWIEVYNPTVATLDLAGWALTDDAAQPAKWTFPAVRLGPNAYRVVFASDKDRRDPDRELHANFKLAGEGEYLGLHDPDGAVAQAFTSFPPQVENASYGPAIRVSRDIVLAAGAGARWTVPAGGPLPDGWARADFDDSGAPWSPGTTGLGFFTRTTWTPPASGDELGSPVADSEADWSVTGTQGENGWTCGSWNRTLDADHEYAAADFVPFPHDGGGYGPSDFWNGTAWDWYGEGPPWTSLGRESARPTGQNSGAEIWAIRRWVADVEGPVALEWFAAPSGPGGNGITATVFHRGVAIDGATVAGDDPEGVTRILVIPDLAPGDPVDLALGPAGPDGLSDDTGDLSVLGGAFWTMPDLRKSITTDVGASMAGQRPGLLARIPLALPAAGAPNRLSLRMRYDDGFAAWLNGQPVAAANAPEAPDGDSTATVRRSDAAATTFQDFEIAGAAALLADGANVLALHGMNASVDDPTFLLLPELDGRRVEYDAGVPRYYGIPTPGEDNDDGTAGLGPLIVEHLTAPGSVAPGQDLVVQARVVPTESPLAEVTLVYRAMFGPEVALPMAPLGGGVFAATIPAGTATAGQMVRWALVARDEAGLLARLPTFPDPLDSEQYFGTLVDDPAVVTSLPVIHWFVETPAAADTRTGTRCAVFFNGEFYDNVRFDLHGQSTAGGAFPKKSYNVDFNSDHRFRLSADYRRMKDINLLTNYADKSKVRNTLAYGAYRDAGTGYHLAFPIRVQRNGAFFSVADFVEDPDDRWLERLGLDPDASLYKMYDGLFDPALGEKKTRRDEDSSDLAAFIAGLGQAGADLRAFLYDHVNLPAMADFYAATTLTANMDCCHKNFYAYRDTNGSGEWRYLPWDVDLTFGRNWIKALTYFDDTMHPQNALFGGGGNKLTAALYAQPEFREMYVRRLRTLMDTVLQAPGTPAADLILEARVDETVARIGADGAADFAAWPKWGQVQTMEQAAEILKADFLAPRRVFLFQTKTADGTIPPAQQDPAVLFGDFDPSPGAPGGAWLTLANPGTVAVDLSGWRVQGDVELLLPPGTVLPALATLYLSPDVVAFRARPVPPTGGQGLMVLGNYAGTLVSTEYLSLLDAAGAPVPSLRVGANRAEGR